jgi:hypothetical protein
LFLISQREKPVHGTPVLVAGTTQLESMGLVAEPEKPASSFYRFAPDESTRTGKWPSYLRCLRNAPQNRDQSRPDVSRADFTCCMTAISWGHGIEQTAARLMEESTRARENGEAYALLTAQNAAAADARNRQCSCH